MHYVYAKNSIFYLGMSNESNIVTIESVDYQGNDFFFKKCQQIIIILIYT